MPEEVRFFGRLSVYALAVGTIYWFLSYEAAGTVLLIGFGIATGAGFLVLRRGTPARSVTDASGDTDGAGSGGSLRPDGPFGDESAPVPTRSSAPLVVGFGVAVIALAGAFGPWFVLAGAVPLLVGAADWLRSANRELSQRARADTAAAANATADAGGAPVPPALPARDR